MREKVTETAEYLFRSEGYHTVSMRRIAKEIGCAPMTLYKYFDSKMDILRTLWGGVFEDLFETINTPDISHLSDQDRLVELAKRYVTFWTKHPDQYRLVFMAEGVSQPDVSIFIDNPDILQKYDVFLEAIQDCAEREDTAEILKLKLDSLICLLHGIAHNFITITGYSWSTIDAIIRNCVPGIISAHPKNR